MWNDWLSSLNGPSADHSSVHADIPEPIETPRRFSNPAQIERLQSLQSQHQQLQVQQLHLLIKQHKLQRELGTFSDSTCAESTSSGTSTPIGGVSAALAEVVSMSKMKEEEDNEIDASLMAKSEEGETIDPSDHGASDDQVSQGVWKQFHALQAQQWAQALNQARIAKRQTSAASSLSPTSMSNGLGSLMQSSNSLSGGKRCKAYAAPKGVWKNNGGYNATIYVHKRRIYGPIRRDLSDAIEDRKEMEDALRELTSIHSSPEDAAILEIEMREVVAGLRNRATPNRLPDLGTGGPVSVSASSVQLPSSSRSISSEPTGSSRKRLRLVGGASEPLAGSTSPDVLGPFASPLQVKPEADDHLLEVSASGLVADMMFDHEEPCFHMRGFTPATGPVYGSPGPMFGSVAGLLGDDHVDMLPESSTGLNSIWG